MNNGKAEAPGKKVTWIIFNVSFMWHFELNEWLKFDNVYQDFRSVIFAYGSVIFCLYFALNFNINDIKQRLYVAMRTPQIIACVSYSLL